MQWNLEHICGRQKVSYEALSTWFKTFSLSDETTAQSYEDINNLLFRDSYLEVRFFLSNKAVGNTLKYFVSVSKAVLLFLSVLILLYSTITHEVLRPAGGLLILNSDTIQTKQCLKEKRARRDL